MSPTLQKSRNQCTTSVLVPIKSMNWWPTSYRYLAAMLTAGLTILPVVQAQQRPPHIGYVYPAGGRQGTTFEVTIGGQYLNNATNVFVSGGGASITIVEQEQQLTPKEQQNLREQLKKLQEMRKAGTILSDDDRKLMAAIKKKLDRFGRKLANPSLGEFVTLQVTLTPNAAVGDREIRLGTERGLSNPLRFCVGQLPEFTKEDWKSVPQSRENMEPRINAAPAPVNIQLPATLNGQIPPGGVDRYRFTALRGQKIIVAASARQLIPYLADAVPGWFQVTMALYDEAGHELDYADHYRFQPDPVLYCEIPKSSEYTIEIRDSLYRGREDFVYRLTAGEMPFITDIFPLGCSTGQTTTVTLRGGNLPITRLTFDAKDKPPGIYPVMVRTGEWISNVLPFAVDDLPECSEQEKIDKPETAQRVQLPVIVNGHIDHPGAGRVFRFDGHTGQSIVAEVRARRLGSPLDSVLKLTDATGKQLAFNDDFEDKAFGLETHHADSYLTATLPADGTYYIYLGDAQHKGGPDFAYRLRISEPRQDFELRAVPGSITARPGGNTPVTIYALRRDGCTNAITIALTNAPAGFMLGDTSVITTQEQVRFVLRVPATALPEPIALHFTGRAVIQDRTVVHTAVPAEDMMQAFLYRHLVPVKEMQVAVMAPPQPRPTPKIISTTPIEIPPGGTGLVRFKFPANTPAGKIQFELNEAPQGITLQSFAPGVDCMELVLRSDATKVIAGQKGRVTVFAWVEKTPSPTKQLIPIEFVPPIPIEISPP